GGVGIVGRAVECAEQRPRPALESLYANGYGLGEQVKGWYTVDERTPDVHPGELEREVGRHGMPHELAEAGAAYASAGDVQRRRQRQPEEPVGTEGPEGPGHEA